MKGPVSLLRDRDTGAVQGEIEPPYDPPDDWDEEEEGWDELDGERLD